MTKKKVKRKKSKSIQAQTQEPLYARTPCQCGRSGSGFPKTDGEQPVGNLNDNWDTFKFTKNVGSDKDNNIIDSEVTQTVPPKSFSDPLTTPKLDEGSKTTEETKDNPFEMFKFTKNVGSDKDNNIIESEVTQTVPPNSFSDPLTVPIFATLAIELKNQKVVSSAIW